MSKGINKEFIEKIKKRVQDGGEGISKITKKKPGNRKMDGSDDEDYSDVEDENPKEYKKGGYHRVNIGDRYKNDRYIVVHKLGWGYFSTVWLCWDSDENKFVAVKIQKSAQQYREAAFDEIRLLTDMKAQDSKLEYNVVHLLDHFEFFGPNGKHVALVFEVMGPNLLSLIRRFDYSGMPLELVKRIIKDVLVGLDYMHRVCKIIHTDLKPENILQCQPSKQVAEVIKNYKPLPKSGVPLTQRTDLQNLSKSQKKKLKKKLQQQAAETQTSTDAAAAVPTEQAPEQPITESTTSTPSSATSPATPAAATTVAAAEESKPKSTETNKKEEEEIGLTPEEYNAVRAKIADFGNSCWTFKKFTDDVQTRQYRSPEVILGFKYSTPIDVWSLACIAFELATGDYLFDPKQGGAYSRDEDHLALMVEIIGNMPDTMKFGGKRTHMFFNKKGDFLHIKKLKFWNLKDVLQEKYEFSEQDAAEFAAFLMPMLEFEPNKRATAEKMLEHPWLKGVNEAAAPAQSTAVSTQETPASENKQQ